MLYNMIHDRKKGCAVLNKKLKIIGLIGIASATMVACNKKESDPTEETEVVQKDDESTKNNKKSTDVKIDKKNKDEEKEEKETKKDKKEDAENNDNEIIDFPIVEALSSEDGDTTTKIRTFRDKNDLINAIEKVFDGTDNKLIDISETDKAGTDNNGPRSFIIKTSESTERLMYFEGFIARPNTDFYTIESKDIDSSDLDDNPYRYIDILLSKAESEKLKFIDIDYLDYEEEPSLVFTFYKEDEISMSKLVEFVKSAVDDNKPEEQDKVDMDALKKLDIKEYNKFVAKSFSKVFNNFIANNNKKENLVFSPYSYKAALEGLGKTTDNFNESNYLGYAVKENLPKELSNLKSKTITMINKDVAESTPTGVDLLKFPQEAAKKSIDLQNEILGHVIKKPDFTEDLSLAIVNASSFKGTWKDQFDIEETKSDNFKNIDGNTVKKDIMSGKIDNVAYSDKEMNIGRKALAQNNSYVYFIEPKSDNYKKIAESIPEKITTIENYLLLNSMAQNNVETYDNVFVKVPRVNISSSVDVLKAEDNEIKTPFAFKDTIKLRDGILNNHVIKEISQVANIVLNEKEVKAEAVTDIKAVTTSLATVQKELEIDCTKPHFVVTVSNGVISFIGFVGY